MDCVVFHRHDATVLYVSDATGAQRKKTASIPVLGMKKSIVAVP
jgi:hypothetical protein